MHPPCPGWSGDLPAPDEPQKIARHLGNRVPNHQDYIYLEIPRSSALARGVISTAIAAVILIQIALLTSIFLFPPLYLESWIVGAALVVIGFWAGIIGWQLDICPPRDQPIRFNRARQKIYAYNFKNTWWPPFQKGRVVPVVYDWSQVRAERWSQTGVVGGGFIFKWGAVLSIVEPGTNRVVDRFQLSYMNAEEHVWAYICTYMQEGPDVLPPPGTPKDHNDLIWCEFALRLAPKVSWPHDMDLESRTSP